ncbi:MAG TPA: LuxR C-terminal-related transcriptional regulator [Hyphomonadaceae bacterium]|nr:LuxR C-terminal-related transcriptional regulator [Hyphomonadaceae bacterium]
MSNRSAYPAEQGDPQGVVHVVDVDHDVQLLLTRWLAAAGIGSRFYSHLGVFLSSHCAKLPGCLIIDAQPLAAGGIEPSVTPSSLATRYPIVVTAHQADVAMAVRAMKTGAVDFVEKPLREREIVAAVCAAIEVDRQQRHIASRYADIHARWATLSRRERQVMALVTSGKLNKQAAADLGLSEITIKAHRGAVMRKMQARSLADLVRMADVVGEPRNGCSA